MKTFFSKIKKLWANKWLRFAVVSIVYILWFVVWTRNPIWMIGLIFIYDFFISRKIDTIFLNKYRAYKADHKGFKAIMEWVEALMFAVVVVVPLKLYFFGLYVIPTSSMENSLMVGDYLYVNKLAYGPKMPNTPISFPFVHHTMPMTKQKNSWVEWIKFDYKRIKGFSKINNDDVVVFQFPAGDTVALNFQEHTYYDLVRQSGYDWVRQNSKVIYRPVDKRENYVKRCAAIAGDTIEMRDGFVFVNGKKQTDNDEFKYLYVIRTDGTKLGTKFFEKYKIRQSEMYHNQQYNTYHLLLTTKQAGEIENLKNITDIERIVNRETNSEQTFPHRPDLYRWNEDNFGPLWIPKMGQTVKLNVENIPLYERIIENYELNDLKIKNNQIYINGILTNSYTFKMNYYFMIGDNRKASADSRYWGFVPEDHIEGKASFTWLSIEEDHNILTGLRFKRMFKKIK